MIEFKVNEYISLKLENNTTYISVNNKYFEQCISLVLNISIENIQKFDNLDSIDEVADNLRNTYDYQEENTNYSIDPETEFWGRCSILQV